MFTKKELINLEFYMCSYKCLNSKFSYAVESYRDDVAACRLRP